MFFIKITKRKRENASSYKMLSGADSGSESIGISISSTGTPSTIVSFSDPVSDVVSTGSDSATVDGIFSSSVGKHNWPGIDPQIQKVCDELKEQLDFNFERTLN